MTADADKSPVRSMEAAIPLPSVRLVHKMTDPETGHTRDVIIEKLVLRDVWHDKHLGIHRRDRIIPGLGVRIPWPGKEPKEEREYDEDTVRLDVEAKTWVPTLLTPPMPTSIIDELRNKYSAFRDRHDEEYLAKKMAEDREAAMKKKALSLAVMTPLQEAKRRERKEKKAKGYAPLTEDTLAKIGEVMAKNMRLKEESQSVSVAA